jgi:hypothetical protein
MAWFNPHGWVGRVELGCVFLGLPHSILIRQPVFEASKQGLWALKGVQNEAQDISD